MERTPTVWTVCLSQAWPFHRGLKDRRPSELGERALTSTTALLLLTVVVPELILLFALFLLLPPQRNFELSTTELGSQRLYTELC